MTTIEVTVPTNSNADDCLQHAADTYAAAHDLAGWDLAPRWADETREAVVLTVPATAKRFAFDGAEYTLADMLTSNADDPDVCDWMQRCEVGDTFDGDLTRIA